MNKMMCPDCDAEIDIPSDVLVAEIVGCPDCGLDFIAVDVDGKIEFQVLIFTTEDHGE